MSIKVYSQVGAKAAPIDVSRPFVDKLRNWAQVVREVTRKRFSDAGIAFLKTWETERAAQALKMPVKEDSLILREARITAVLVSPFQREAVPLYEGTNFLRVGEKGLVERIIPTNLLGADPQMIQFRMIGSEIELLQSGQEPRRCVTNDLVALGSGRYLLKVFPRKHHSIRYIREIEV
jgi:hypothetical protein